MLKDKWYVLIAMEWVGVKLTNVVNVVEEEELLKWFNLVLECILKVNKIVISVMVMEKLLKKLICVKNVEEIKFLLKMK